MDLILIIIILLLLLFRGRFWLFPLGIWRRHRYRRYFADRASGLFVSRTRKIVIFAPPDAFLAEEQHAVISERDIAADAVSRAPRSATRIRIATPTSISEPHLPSRTLDALYTRS